MLSHFSCVQLFGTPWALTRQAPLSMGISEQEYWRGLPFFSLGDLPNPGIEPTSLMSHAPQAGSLPLSYLESPHTLLTTQEFQDRRQSRSVRPPGLQHVEGGAGGWGAIPETSLEQIPKAGPTPGTTLTAVGKLSVTFSCERPKHA